MTDTQTPGEDLRRRAQRIMDNLDEIAERQEEVKREYLAAKSEGYDVPALKLAIKLARMDEDGRIKAKEKLMLTDTYCAALGIQMSFDLEGVGRDDGATMSIDDGPKFTSQDMKHKTGSLETEISRKPKKRAAKKRSELIDA